jgi:hypothetical protein
MSVVRAAYGRTVVETLTANKDSKAMMVGLEVEIEITQFKEAISVMFAVCID